jgi:uncharacterized protein
MKSVFADTFYFLALLNPRDLANARAAAFTQSYLGSFTTTTWVLTEVADAMTRPGPRSIAARFIDLLPQQRAMRIIPASEKLFKEGLALYSARSDKD